VEKTSFAWSEKSDAQVWTPKCPATPIVVQHANELRSHRASEAARVLGHPKNLVVGSAFADRPPRSQTGLPHLAAAGCNTDEHDARVLIQLVERRIVWGDPAVIEEP
jgi:hypothetical protein